MGSLSYLLRFVADLLCPERCAACSVLVGADKLFCQACCSRLTLFGPPECARCGHPLANGATCTACVEAATQPIRYARAFASYHSGEGRSPVAEALAAFKYRGAQRLGRRMGLAMLSRVPPAVPNIVVPVPLHPRRLRRRGYNQSAVLARHIARGLGCPIALDLLTRVRDTPSQTALTAVGRITNIAGAFVVNQPAEVRGRTVLLIDDVWTSGATAAAAATTLAEAGAQAVDVLTFARVLETETDGGAHAPFEAAPGALAGAD